jgi:hypothetical protein
MDWAGATILAMKSVDSIPRTPTGPRNVTLRTDLETFLASHSAHGPLTGNVGRHPVIGYRHRIACSCGATFHRYSTRQGDGAVHRHRDLPPVGPADLAFVELASV